MVGRKIKKNNDKHFSQNDRTDEKGQRMINRKLRDQFKVDEGIK